VTAEAPVASPNPFREATAAGLLDAIAVRHPAREAIVFGDERITFAELRERAETLARGLAALGIGHGDAVAVWLPNRPAWFVVQQACARLGAVVVALNPRYRGHELAYILAQSDARALLLTDHLGGVDYFETLHEILPGLRHAVPGEIESDTFPALRHVIVDADDPYPGCHRLADVVGAGQAGPRPPGDDRRRSRATTDDVFTLLYTSGTTSFPKGALITHANCVPHAWNCGEVLRLTPDDRVLHALPAAGTWGGVNIPLTTWSHGASLVLMESYDPLQALVLIERERCTVWNAVDAMLKAMLAHPDLDRYDRSSLRTGGIAVVGGGEHGLFEAAVERIGIRHAYQPYGMTECNAMALVHDLDEPVELRALPGIRPLPGLEVRVVHPETGMRCAPGDEGELQFRGERVTRGYYKKPAETAAAFTEDGWFRTGDLAVQDARGHTIFKGRLKEVLRINHFMVAPGEIEAFLMSHPAVAQAFVVGVPDPVTSEAAIAYVIPKPAAHLTEDELRGWCHGRIASFKIPRAVRFVADVPRTPGPHGDKVQRGKLREQALAELGRLTPACPPSGRG
jgi:fatty-acyl-CoA synthase